MPEKQAGATPWESTMTGQEALAKVVLPGVFLKAWIEPQPNLPGLKSASLAHFYVLGVSPMALGLDLNVLVVGARAASLQNALESGPFPKDLLGGPGGALHLCTKETCVSSQDPAITDRLRIHTIAVSVCLRPEVVEKYCQEGLRAVEKYVAKNPSACPPFLKSSAHVQQTEAEKAEVAALSKAVGTPGTGGWRSSRLAEPGFVGDKKSYPGAGAGSPPRHGNGSSGSAGDQRPPR